MKRNRVFSIYIILAILIGIFVVIGFIVSKKTMQKNLSTTDYNVKWNKVMSDAINQRPIIITIDKEKIRANNQLYFTENMQLMLPVSIISEGFHCAQNLYNKKKLVIEKGSNKAVMNLNSAEMKFNGNKYTLDWKVEKKKDEVYVPAQLFTDYLNYEFDWNSEKGKGTFTNQAKDNSFLPEQYNYLTEGKNVRVKDQGNHGTCWAFATLTALESSLLPEESLDFSENNLIHNNLLSDEIHDGGDYVMSMAYLMSWNGPVTEESDPYGSAASSDKMDVVKHVQGAEIIPSKDYEQIKEKVFQYGGVESSMYMASIGNAISDAYYNSSEYAYCYKGDEKSNHDVVIIGWDDHFSKNLFHDSSIKKDGAFICLNSWGEDFGDQGVFYISYEDSCIGTINVCYTDVEDTDNYDMIYQYDMCGWIGALGFEGSNTAYFANVFKAKSEESLRAVGFYATEEKLEYDVFVCQKYFGKLSLNDRTHIAASGKLKNEGYYTIKLDHGYPLKKGDEYAVIVKVKNTKNKDYKLIPAEMERDGMNIQVDLSDGKGFISSGGEKWQSAEKQNCNICLKAYTQKR